MISNPIDYIQTVDIIKNSKEALGKFTGLDLDILSVDPKGVWFPCASKNNPQKACCKKFQSADCNKIPSDLLGNVDPGHSIGYGFGTAIALSYQTAINFQFERSITSKLERDHFPVNGSYLNSASLKTGFTSTLSERFDIDIGITTGLTTDARDYVAEVRFPYTF